MLKRLVRMWLHTLVNTCVKPFASLALGNQVVSPIGTVTPQLLASLLAGPFVPLAASGAIPQPANSSQTPRLPGKYVITKSSAAAALTLATPAVGIDDGVCLQIISTTAQAHTITCTAGKIQDGNSSGHNTVMTFNAEIGASCILEAYQGIWYVISEIGCSLTS